MIVLGVKGNFVLGSRSKRSWTVVNFMSYKISLFFSLFLLFRFTIRSEWGQGKCAPRTVINKNVSFNRLIVSCWLLAVWLKGLRLKRRLKWFSWTKVIRKGPMTNRTTPKLHNWITVKKSWDSNLILVMDALVSHHN